MKSSTVSLPATSPVSLADFPESLPDPPPFPDDEFEWAEDAAALADSLWLMLVEALWLADILSSSLSLADADILSSSLSLTDADCEYEMLSLVEADSDAEMLSLAEMLAETLRLALSLTDTD